MLRLVAYLLAVLAVASGLAWLADRPGQLIINWQGNEIETSVFHAVVILTAVTALAIFVWSLLRQLWNSPASVGQFLNKRRQRRGLDALSSGMIAVGAGDRSNATRYAILARKSLPNEPLTHLLRAQAAQLSGDRSTARRIYEAMLASPDTEQLGLRGLFVEAQREGAHEPAQQYSQRALRLNPKLAWPVDALFDLQCREGNWQGALDTLSSARRNGHVEKAVADRRRAVLLTAQAQAVEDSDAESSLALALEAHALAPDLIPAAAIAGRVLASKGNTPRAAKVLRRTWSKAPHPELATAYAYARVGDSPLDRLDRVKQLAALRPYAVESPIAVAAAAIEARNFDEARHALAPLLEPERLTHSAATLMARIEGEQHGDKGRVREWLARAAGAQRDAAWTADGVVADRWAAISPVTGQLDAFVWKVPLERVGDSNDAAVLQERLDEIVALSVEDGRRDPMSVPPAEQADEPAAGDASDPRTASTDVVAAKETDAAAKRGNGQSVPTDPRPNGEPEVGRIAGGATPRGRGASVSAAETKIFVPPRAPDDPGADEELDEGPVRPYRPT